MKFIFLIIVLAVASAQANYTCPGNRDDLLQCFDTFIDKNHDGNITVAELTEMFVDHLSCLPTQTPEYLEHYTPAFIMSQCDADGNGVLNVLDWNHANACLKQYNTRHYVCRLCKMCQQKK